MRAPNGRLHKQDRHKRILDELRVKPAVRVLEVARRLGVHVQTIRRDLDELHSGGKISRTYGGAILVSANIEPSIDERDRLLIGERTRIGQRAAQLIESGEVVMIDVGSTTSHFARCLALRGCELRLITNSWRVVASVAREPHVRTVLCPGEYSQRQGGVAGPDTTEYLHKYHADKAVLSVGGLAADGLYEYEPDFASVKRAMLEHAETRILLVDHSKFGRKVMTRVCGLEMIEHLVVDRLPDGDMLEALEAARVRLHVAGP
jgi:DeoR/GlpR family transcriptional regulator of sugar metabolism